MQTLHIHGWRRYGITRKKLYICCTSPSCYMVRSWHDIINRLATCTKCFQRFIILGYQLNSTELRCHICTHKQLSESEQAIIDRLTIEANKDELIKLILCNQKIVIEENKPIPLEEIKIEDLPSIIVIPEKVAKSIEVIPEVSSKALPKVLPEVPLETIPETPISSKVLLEFVDIEPTPKSELSLEEEEKLKVTMEKKLRKLLERRK